MQLGPGLEKYEALAVDRFRALPSKTVETLGFVPRWLVCGPFPAGDESEAYRLYRMGRFDVPDIDPIGGELFIEPLPGMAHQSDLVPGKEVRWRPLEVNSAHINFFPLFPEAKYGIAYAATYLESRADELFVCDLRPQMVGRLIVNHLPLCPDYGFVQVPLRAGCNLLVLKVFGAGIRGAGWGAVCRFMKAKPVGASGLAVVAPRPTGFFRGTAEKPEVEVQFALANASDSDILDVTAKLSSKELGSQISRSLDVIRAQETKGILSGLPLTSGWTERARLLLEVSANSATCKMSRRLEVPRPPESDATVYLGVGFHFDPVWTNTQAMYNEVSLHNVTQYLFFCRADPSFKVIFHELDYLKPYLDFYPNDRDYLIALGRQGRVILGGSYNEPNEKNISGEQLIRNIIYGKLFASSFFGAHPRVYHAWDVFGHVVQLSQILRKTGNVGVVWSKTVKGFPPVFRHMSLDGSTVIHRRVDYGFTTASLDQMRERAYAGLKEMQSLGHNVDLRMDCSDFKSPTAWMLGRVEELKSLLPRIQVGDPADFFDEILRQESSGILVPMTSRDPSQYHIGTSQSRIELKIANRLAEAALYNAELLCTLASLLGMPYPDLVLDKAWRQLLFNSHHDAISGTSCDKSYLDLLQGYREAVGLATRAVSSALGFLASKAETSNTEGVPLLIFNTLNWPRTDLVRTEIRFDEPVQSFRLLDESGRQVPFAVISSDAGDGGVASAEIEFIARDVPSLGYLTYSVKPLGEGKLPQWTSNEGGLTIENEFFRISVDAARGGGICSIIDKEENRELVPAGAQHLANEIVILEEKNERNEPSWEFYTTGEKMFLGDLPAQVRTMESGPTVKLEARVGIGEGCELVRGIILHRGIRRIDFRTEIAGYGGKDDLFVAIFPTDLEGAAPTYEEKFGAIVKHRGRRAFDYRTWRADAFSDCVIHSSQNFFDFGSTTKVRFVDRQSRTVGSCPLGSVALVLPHSKDVQSASTDLQRALANRGILTSPCFDDDDLPRRANLTHLDSTEAPEKNQDLSGCNFRISIGQAGNNKYSVSVLTGLDRAALKRFNDRVAKDGFDFILALDRQVPEGWDPVPVLIIEAKNSECLGKAIEFLANGLKSGDLVLPEHANCIGAKQVQDYGLSILNRGNMANTVEPDGTMTLLLKHTSNWSRVHLDEEFIPERKDHVFFYALYPHTGSWREAQSYRRGWEYNVPMLCMQTDSHRGVLPARHSFIEISPENLVLAACKPKGNPVAAFSSQTSHAGEGMILRIYDAEGRESRAKIRFAFPIESAWRTDLLENRQSAIDVDQDSFFHTVGPFSIETFEVKPSISSEKHKEAALHAGEAVQPIYTRYWKENLGAAPIGYMPVAISIQGTPITEAGGRGTTINRVSVSIVNNYVDAAISGNAVVEAPAGWEIQPETIRYEVPPQSHRSYEVAFSNSGLRRTGLLRARLVHRGQVYEDVIEIGEQSKITYTGGGLVYQDVLKVQMERALRWTAFALEDRIIVRLENPYNERIDGGVALIVPLEFWSRAEVGEYSLAEVNPPVQAFHIPPRSFQVLEFKVRSNGQSTPRFWAYAKLFYMGRTDYKRVR